MTQQRVKPVLLGREQLAAIEAIQAQERSKSPLGIAPTVHVIARQLIDKAVRDLKGEKAWSN